MEQSTIAPLNGPMNWNIHPKYVNTESGQVYKRINMRSSSNEGTAYINNKIKGTQLIDISLPSGNNKAIGWGSDTQNKALVVFVYNSNNNHSVYRYYTHSKTIELLWFGQSELDLEDAELRAVVVEGKVYWVNGSKPPKSFDLEYARRYTSGEGGDESYSIEYEPFDVNVFPLIKTPPQFAPSCQYEDDYSKKFNNLRKKLFQFKYAYQYYDNQVSAWSAISQMPLPLSEVDSEGIFDINISKNNLISIAINTGSKAVKSILVAARDVNPRNTGSFFQFETIDKYDKNGGRLIEDEIVYTVQFYNNKRDSSIDTEINNRYADDVPLSGKDIALVDGKYLAIAYPEIGYDDIEVDVDLVPIEIDTETVEGNVYHEMLTTQQNHIKDFNITVEDFAWIQFPSVVYPDTTYKITFYVEGTLVVSELVVTNQYPLTTQGATQIRDWFRNDIRDKIIALGYFFSSTLDGTWWLGFYPRNFLNTRVYIVTKITGKIFTSNTFVLPAYRTLKRGQYHPFGIIYNDRNGRYNTVIPIGEVLSPYEASNAVEDVRKRVSVEFTINHRPPIWAHTYRFAYIRNKSYTYFQYFANVKVTAGQGVNPSVGNGIPENKYFIELNQSLQRIRDLYPNFYPSDYVWQNGDRIRLIGSDDNYEVLQQFTWVQDDEESSGVNGFLVDVDLSDSQDPTVISLVEVYRPNPTPQEIIYEEIGEEYLILEPGTNNRRHSGFIPQSEDLSVPASGELTFGDAYVRYRLVANEDGSLDTEIPIEDESFSDYYRSDAVSIGRAAAKIDLEKKFLNRVVRSENYIENTEYNLLNVWLSSSDYFSASDEFGEIVGIEQSGDVLKVIQEHKETSVYVGRNAVKQADGTDIVLATDKVFGTTNRYIEFRGTTYRKSMASNRRYLYFFDENTGEFIRSSPNGQMAISSQYNMAAYFEAKAKQIREYSGDKDIIVGINNDYNEVFLSFIIENTIETIVFDEDDNNKGFNYFIELSNNNAIPNAYAHFGDELFSFVNGKIYLHDVGAKNLFYGSQKEASISFFANKFPSQQKVLKNIRVSSDKNIWDVEITTPAGVNYNAQKTILKPTIFRERNNQIVSDILRNIISRNGQESVNLLYRGEKMIGEYATVKISNDTSEDVELREVEVKFLIST